ncbi:MAG: peptide deformylase [Pseudomonadota bacterium]|nr:peptide deformylase [Pseudomonadota bacterium]
MFAIRCFGDAVLGVPTQSVDFSTHPDLPSIIAKMMGTLRDKGGVGIAANQCADIPAPAPSIIIVGVADEETRSKAQLRYPNLVIPDAHILINPVIIAKSIETLFLKTGEGCLSVPCSFRGKVLRHHTVVVQYQDIHGKPFERELTELQSYIVQHECDHLHGIVIIHKLLHDMLPEQRHEFVTLIDAVLADPLPADQRPKVPTIAMDRDADGFVKINVDLIIATLSDLDQSVLLALKRAALDL